MALTRAIHGMVYEILSPSLYVLTGDTLESVAISIEKIAPQLVRLDIQGRNGYQKHFYTMDQATRWFGEYVSKGEIQPMLDQMVKRN